MARKAFLIAVAFIALGAIGARADAAPMPDENPKPCAEKVEGDSCSHRLWGPKDQVCRWNDIGGSGYPEYFVRRIVARGSCTVVSNEGEPLKARCLECVEKTDSKEPSNPR